MARVYISGPITGISNYRDNFRDAEKYLSDNGFDVINPVAVSDVLPNMEYEELMTLDLALIDMSDVICMTNGWKDSLGCNREYGYAIAKNKEVIRRDLIIESKGEYIKKEAYYNVNQAIEELYNLSKESQGNIGMGGELVINLDDAVYIVRREAKRNIEEFIKGYNKAINNFADIIESETCSTFTREHVMKLIEKLKEIPC